MQALLITSGKIIHFHEVTFYLWINLRFHHAGVVGIHFEDLLPVDKEPGEDELEGVEVLPVLHRPPVLVPRQETECLDVRICENLQLRVAEDPEQVPASLERDMT